MRHIITIIAAHPNLIKPDTLLHTLHGQAEWRWIEEPIAGDLHFKAAPSAGLLSELQFLCATARLDMIAQPEKGREKKLLISDMDSTMIGQECIDELADCVGLKAEVSAITERAMNGELDFKQALAERVALLKGLREEQLQEVYDARIKPTRGAETLVKTMRNRGAYCLLVSGGFRFFTSRVAEALGFHADESNELEFENGVLTGRVVEPILDKQSKQESLLRAMKQKKIRLEATLAIGDGANDVPMLQHAALGVAYRAKPNVQRIVTAKLNFTDLTSLLYAQGIARKDWVE